MLVLASCYDITAKNLVSRWSNFGAKLLTCEDLSKIGWQQFQDSNKISTAVADGEIVPTEEIRGVLVRLPFVMEQELLHIVPEDRDYVAAEMTSFLLYWLSTLKCPVINRPTSACLCGPNWRHEQWIHTASKIGMNVESVKRHTAFANYESHILNPNSCVKVTVVGEKCFGQTDEILSNQAKLLAKAAGVNLLCVKFSGSDNDPFFVGADLILEKIEDNIADAILQCFVQDQIDSDIK
ncbi:MAG: hypothetical protein KGI19_10555 [Thaumarchaeota archaeon]|nr:hypothetical protein [Nitrososphaerota archaeon]